MRLDRILVLCTGNICRSPIAEALLASELAHVRPRCVVESAGIAALVDHPADPHAIEIMAARGLDIRAHRARQLSGALGRVSDLVLVMESGQRRFVERRWPLLHGRVHELGRWGDFEIDDPYRQPRAAFEASLEMIERGIADWLPILSRQPNAF